MDNYFCLKCKEKHSGFLGEKSYQGLFTAHYEHRIKTEDDFKAFLKHKKLGFGWFNGLFITV